MNNTQVRQVDDSHNPNPDLISADPVIERVDKRDDWLGHRETFVQELCPVGTLETLYAERAALYLWRLDRVIGFENAAKIGEIDAGSDTRREDSPESRSNLVLPDQSELQTIIKYEAHLHRCLAGTMAELRRLQKERRQGLRDVNPGVRGADRAGVCQNQQIKDGSPGGSPSQKSSPIQKGSPTQSITSPEMSIPGGGGADRAGGFQNQQIKDGSPGGSPSHKSSPSHQITRPEMSIPGGRGADRAGGCQHQQIKDGSPGGSPSHKSSPSHQITRPEMSIPGGRGADQAGVGQHQQIKDGSPGGSPSQTGSPSRKSSTSQKSSTSKKNSATRSLSHTQRASPIPKPPPLLASITNRRRLEEYTRGEIFERNVFSSTLDIAMIPHS
jgi:hypothetical protein